MFAQPATADGDFEDEHDHMVEADSDEDFVASSPKKGRAKVARKGTPRKATAQKAAEAEGGDQSLCTVLTRAAESVGDYLGAIDVRSELTLKPDHENRPIYVVSLFTVRLSCQAGVDAIFRPQMDTLFLRHFLLYTSKLTILSLLLQRLDMMIRWLLIASFVACHSPVEHPRVQALHGFSPSCCCCGNQDRGYH